MSYEWVKYRLVFSSDASTVVVSNANNYGAIVIYDVNYNNNTTTFRSISAHTFTPDYWQTNFGRKIAINANGTVIAVAAYNSTAYYSIYSNLYRNTSRIMFYTRTLGSGPNGWTLNRDMFDFDVPGVKFPSFGADMCLNDAGTVIYISIIT